MKAKSALLRLPASLHRALVKEAEAAGLSFNQFCTKLLTSAVLSRRNQGEPLWLKPVLDLYRDEGLLGVVLFGSAARGQAREDSDIDLLLVFPSGMMIQRALYRRFEAMSLESAQLRKISIHCLPLPSGLTADGETFDFSSLWLEVGMEGQILWSGTPLLARALDQIRKAIAGGMYRRKTIHGQGYWLKESVKTT